MTVPKSETTKLQTYDNPDGASESEEIAPSKKSNHEEMPSVLIRNKKSSAVESEVKEVQSSIDKMNKLLTNLSVSLYALELAINEASQFIDASNATEAEAFINLQAAVKSARNGTNNTNKSLHEVKFNLPKINAELQPRIATALNKVTNNFNELLAESKISEPILKKREDKKSKNVVDDESNSLKEFYLSDFDLESKKNENILEDEAPEYSREEGEVIIKENKIIRPLLKATASTESSVIIEESDADTSSSADSSSTSDDAFGGGVKVHSESSSSSSDSSETSEDLSKSANDSGAGDD